MDACLSDNTKARALQSDGTYLPRAQSGERVDSQQRMMDQALACQVAPPAPIDLRPQRSGGWIAALKRFFTK